MDWFVEVASFELETIAEIAELMGYGVAAGSPEADRQEPEAARSSGSRRSRLDSCGT